MVSFREWLREAAECKSEVKESTEYKEYFKKILAKYNVEDPSELSKEDKQKFFDDVDAGWKGDEEESEAGDVNEAKQMVDKKQLEWFIGLANKAKDLDSFIDDLNLMKGLVK